MFTSGEIRWFFPGTTPADVKAWFTSGSLSIDETERVDEYLLLPGCVTTSVKLRDGRFEVKSNLQPPVPVTYAPNASGMQDAWIKWSRKARDPEVLRELLVGNGDTWVPVGKRRHLRLFSLHQGSIEEVRPGTARLVKGCQVELSSVRWRNEVDWWSLSFEAFGARGEVLQNLDGVARHFFGNPPPLRLTQHDSMSYPVWLLANGATCRD